MGTKAGIQLVMLAGPTIHLALAGTGAVAPTTPRALAWARDLGARGVRLDATRPDARPRDLDRSARRDLAASLRRHELAFGGLDLLIPPEHFARPDTVDRAVGAVEAALELALDLARGAGDPATPAVTIVLPPDAPASTLESLDGAGDRLGGVVVDLAYPAQAALGAEGIAVGIDPAAVLIAGDDPASAVAQAHSLGEARASDLDSQGRCALGTPGGRLDLGAYIAACAVSGRDAITLDVRGTRDPAEAARQGLTALARAATLPGSHPGEG